MRSRSNSRGFIVGSVIGGFIGAAGVLLLTTEKGQSVRQELSQFAANKSPKITEMLLEMGEEWTEEIEDMMQEAMQPDETPSSAKSNEKEHTILGDLIDDTLEKEQPYS